MLLRFHRLINSARFCIAAGIVVLTLGGLTSCQSERTQAIQALEENKVELSSLSLIKALEKGNAEQAELLLKAGVKPESINQLGQNTTMLALQGNQPSIALKALELGDHAYAKDFKKKSSLWYAIEYNEPSVVKRLLDKGADPNLKTDLGASYLAYSLKTGRHSAALLLLEAGADPNSTDEVGNSVLGLSCFEGHDHLAQTLIEEHGAKEKSHEYLLHQAANSGKKDLLLYLLKKGRSPNKRDADGLTPLHHAVLNQKSVLTDELLKAGARPNAVTPQRWSALHLAAAEGDEATAKVLVSHGANVHKLHHNQSPLDVALANREFKTAAWLLHLGSHPRDWLHTAVENKDEILVGFLLGNGVLPSDVWVGNKDTPLNIAVKQSNYSLTALLLRHGAPVNALGYDHATPLHQAVAAIDIPMTRLLLDHGADTEVQFTQPCHPDFVERIKSDGVIKWFLRNDKRIYPIMMAADSRSMEMVDTLMKAGADMTTYTRRHRLRPYSFAVRRQDIPMAKLMFGRDPERDERKILVDLSKQRLTLYDEEGEVLMTSVISSGKKGHRTPTGSYIISNKYRRWESTIYEGSAMPFFQRLSGSDFGFHYGNCPGYPASHGCIRMPWSRAEKLFGMTQLGDRVTINY